MKKKQAYSGILLALVAGVALLACMLLRAFLPRVILPRWDGIAILSLSLIAVVLDHYLAKEHCRVYWQLPLYAAVVFGVFPWVACFVQPLAALWSAVLGAVIFTATVFLFDTMVKRLPAAPVAKAAPAGIAFGVFLAAQALTTLL